MQVKATGCRKLTNTHCLQPLPPPAPTPVAVVTSVFVLAKFKRPNSITGEAGYQTLRLQFPG